jgi:hypothetical protein
MLAALFCFSASWSRTYHFIGLSSVAQLRSFGFQAGGTFDISITSSENSSIVVFLATLDELRTKLYQDIMFSSSCSDPSPFIARYNRSFRMESSIFQWSGEIDNEAVYLPYIIDCREHVTPVRFTIAVEFANRDFMIDYRDKDYPVLNLAFAFVNSFLSVIWLANSCCCSKFCVGLHWFMTFSTITRALLLSCSAMQWEGEKVGLPVNGAVSILSDVIGIIHYAVFIAIPQFIFGGYGIYRENYGVKTLASVLASSGVLVGGIFGFGHMETVKDAIICLAMVLIGSVWYLQVGLPQLIMFARLVRYVEGRSDAFGKKVDLASMFGQVFAVVGVVVLGCGFMAWAFEFWQIVASTFFESGIVLVVLVEMWIFLLRKEYEGQSLNIDDVEMDLTIIQDPTGSEVAIVQRMVK